MRVLKLRHMAMVWIALICTAAGAKDLELSISTPKTRYLLDEPLYLTVTVRNIGKTDAEIWRALLETETSGIVIRITEPDGKAYAWSNGIYVDWEKVQEHALHLSPGESFSRALDITYAVRRDASVFTLHDPGQYKIRVRGRDYADSNELVLTVVEPTGADQRAHDLFAAAPYYGKDRNWRFPPEQRTCYDTLAARYPASPYGLYAMLFLAPLRMESDRMDEGTTVRRERLLDCIRMCKYVTTRAPRTPMSLKTMWLRARAEAMLGNFGDAGDTMEAAITSPSATTQEKLDLLCELNALSLKLRGITTHYLPMPALASAFGWSTEWNPAERVYTVRSPRMRTEFYGSGGVYRANGVKKQGPYSSEGPWSEGKLAISAQIAVDLILAHYQTEDLKYMSDPEYLKALISRSS